MVKRSNKRGVEYMNIFVTNSITSNQYHEAMELTQKCALEDGTHGISFLEQELNAIEEFPCFYMMYDGSRLVSYLSVFIPDETQCEIYGGTLPSERGKGYFKRLLSEALTHIRKYGIERKLMVIEPGCKDMEEYLTKINAKFEDSDFLMSYDKSVKPVPKKTLKMTHEKKENTEYYQTLLDGEKIGSCKVEFTRTQAVIYDFMVEEEYRTKGYGTETLLLILKHVLETDIDKILLHVNGANKAAHIMYSHHGFVEEQQIDYWLIG